MLVSEYTKVSEKQNYQHPMLVKITAAIYLIKVDNGMVSLATQGVRKPEWANGLGGTALQLDDFAISAITWTFPEWRLGVRKSTIDIIRYECHECRVVDLSQESLAGRLVFPGNAHDPFATQDKTLNHLAMNPAIPHLITDSNDVVLSGIERHAFNMTVVTTSPLQGTAAAAFEQWLQNRVCQSKGKKFTFLTPTSNCY
jgi:hypothetical protein